MLLRWKLLIESGQTTGSPSSQNELLWLTKYSYVSVGAKYRDLNANKWSHYQPKSLNWFEKKQIYFGKVIVPSLDWFKAIYPDFVSAALPHK